MADVEYRILERYVSSIGGNELIYIPQYRRRQTWLSFKWWEKWRNFFEPDTGRRVFYDDIKKAEWRLVCFDLEYEIVHEVNPTLWIHHKGPGSNFDIDDLPAEFDHPASAPAFKYSNAGPGAVKIEIDDYPHVPGPGRE